MRQEEEQPDELEKLKSRIPPKAIPTPSPEYFQQFPDRVIARWKQEQSETKHTRLSIRRWIAIAAISVGLLIGGWWWMNHSVVAPSEAFSSAEAYQYVIEHIGEFSGLMEQEVSWPTNDKINLPESSPVEEYLLDELDGQDPEQIF
jgi:hypothetical protein